MFIDLDPLAEYIPGAESTGANGSVLTVGEPEQGTPLPVRVELMRGGDASPYLHALCE